jgi:hypothetical protein
MEDPGNAAYYVVSRIWFGGSVSYAFLEGRLMIERYQNQVRLLLNVLPIIADIDFFALKGGRSSMFSGVIFQDSP